MTRLFKKNRIKFKTYWETGMAESYINLYKERKGMKNGFIAGIVAKFWSPGVELVQT